jgi:hypothetical protein
MGSKIPQFIGPLEAPIKKSIHKHNYICIYKGDSGARVFVYYIYTMNTFSYVYIIFT